MIPALLLGFLALWLVIAVARSRPSGRMDEWGDYDEWQARYGNPRGSSLERYLQAEHDHWHRGDY